MKEFWAKLKELLAKLCSFLMPLILRFVISNRASFIAELEEKAKGTKGKYDDLAVRALEKLLAELAEEKEDVEQKPES